MKRTGIALVFVLACDGATTAPPGGDDTITDVDAGMDPAVVDPCAAPVVIPLAGRALDLMPPSKLGEVASRAPCIVAGTLRETVESVDTFWYDKHSLTPGYQDSFGDNIQTPIGFRPNTIDPGLINLAVPGGHAQIFQSFGVFHFPFGTPIGPVDNVRVFNFWRPSRDASGAVLPVVHWQRDPNGYTHRVEWMFPAGTVFGEALFLDESGTLYPFEIRTRTRTVDGWVNDVYRPFPRAVDLADAIEARRTEQPAWASSPTLDALVAQLRGTTLAPFQLKNTNFPGSFPTRDAGIDTLPAMTGSDAELIHTLLMTTAFRSARGIAWKEASGRVAFAAGASGRGTIVPKGYNAAAVDVSEASCDVCHRDAGRPFETWYDNILAYGELWGNDEIFTWHPFTLASFVDAQGKVVNFNHDNRVIRADMKAAGLVAPYKPASHPPNVYKRVVREWTDFAY
jgi:hypothetical protein